MNERERILDLVKKGVLSTEEALDLLESIAKRKDDQQIKKAADAVDNSHKEDKEIETTEAKAKSLIDHLEAGTEEAGEDPEDAVKKQEAADQENLEKILDELATKANRTSAELDEINAEIAGVKTELKENQEALMQLNTKEELDALSEDELQDRAALETEIRELDEKLSELAEEKAQLEAELKDIRKNQWDEKKDSISQKFDIPEDWREKATETFNQVGGQVTEAGLQIGKLLKQTFKSVSEAVSDNVEWKDISLKVPGVATTKFEHVFLYPDTNASLLDIKLANGKVTLKTWAENDVKVEAKIKLYGKMDAETPLAAFMERSQIEVDDDRILFQVPNKRVGADLTFYLPQRVYDHVAINLLNGNVVVEELDVKDVYAKSTNGTIEFQTINATMIEVHGVNGAVEIGKGDIIDALIETVNGTIIGTANVQNYGVSLVNGDVKLTVTNDNLRKIKASSVNGDVKVALPAALSVEGLAKTSLGSVNSRMTEYDVVREKKERTNQMLQFRRIHAEEAATVDLSTTTGSIFLKDSDK